MMAPIQAIALGDIRPSPHNPRAFRDDDASLVGLSESIRELGVLLPILVRPVQGVNGNGSYELIAGERRWRASQKAGQETIPAIVREDLTDREALALTVTENLQREDLHPLEEANGVAALVASGDDYRAVADPLGKSLGWVARRARLAQLSPAWRKRVTEPEGPFYTWTGAHLELVARLDPAVQDEILEDLGRGYGTQGMTASSLNRWLADYTRELKRFPWKLDDDTLVAAAGACAACPKRSSCHPGLFEEEIDGKTAANDRCLDAQCYRAKMNAYLERQAGALKERHGDVAFTSGEAWHSDPAPEFATGKLEPSWKLKQAKKSTKGSVAVLVVSGPKVGTTYYAVRRSDGRGAASRAGAGKPATAAEQLEQRKQKLEGRRKALAIAAFREDLRSGVIASPAMAIVWRMAAVFGTAHTFDYADSSHFAHDAIIAALGGSGPYIKPWKAFEHLETVTNAGAAAALWASVRLVLDSRLVFHDNGQALERWDELERIAAILNADPETYLAAAIEELPEPKSWAKLRAEVEAETSG